MGGRPFHFDQVDGVCTAYSEMQPEVALGHDASAAMYFVDLGMLAHDHAHARTNGCSIALCAKQLDFDPVLLIPANIVQQRRQIVHVVDEDVDAAIVVVVPKGRAPA